MFLPFLDPGQPVLAQAIAMTIWIHEKGYPWWAHLLNAYAAATVVMITAFGCIPVIFRKRPKAVRGFDAPPYY